MINFGIFGIEGIFGIGGFKLIAGVKSSAGVLFLITQASERPHAGYPGHVCLIVTVKLVAAALTFTLGTEGKPGINDAGSSSSCILPPGIKSVTPPTETTEQSIIFSI